MIEVIPAPTFESFPKIPRLMRDITITEKIDGTNGQILITEYGDLFAGSRNRLLSEGSDNFGFRHWVMGHREELLKLGPGRHFGEWWGSGIQRGYGLTKGERRFSLFNTKRWSFDDQEPSSWPPGCCHVVPILYVGPFDTNAVQRCMQDLNDFGSFARPDFMNPEGIMIYHHGLGGYFKHPFDPNPKTSTEQIN